MACPEFVDLLVDYTDLDAGRRELVDSHVAVCAECAAFQSALKEVDWTLTAAFAGLEAPPDLRKVMAQNPLRPPSFIPVMLDLAASIAVLVVAFLALEIILSDLQVELPQYSLATALFVAAATVVGFRSYADIKN